MWLWSEKNEYIQVILMLVYSGVRPGELFAVKKEYVNLEELIMGKTVNVPSKYKFRK